MKIRDGQVANRPIYVVPGINCYGERDVLGLWIGTGGEGAKHWMSVLTELRNRGVIAEVWPLATVQSCVVHLVRTTLRYASNVHWSAITKALRTVYTAPTADVARARFAAFGTEWADRYPAIVRLWRSSWEQFTPFLGFPPEIRKIIYTTNAVESLNSRFRQAAPPARALPERRSRCSNWSSATRSRTART